MPEYKYYIEGIEVHPVNERGYKFKWNKKEDTKIYRMKSDNKFIVKNDLANGYTDYDYLKRINDGEHSRIGKYDTLTFLIIEEFGIPGKAPEEFWRGEFKVTNSKFNVHRQQVEFTATVKDGYSEFYENGDTDINLKNITDLYNIDINYHSTLEFYPDFPADNPDANYYSLWIDFYHDYTTKEIFATQQNGNVHYNIWAYERLILPKYIIPTGDDWYIIITSEDYITWGRPWDTDSHFDAVTINDIEFHYPIIDGSNGYKSIIKVRDVAELWVTDSYELKYNDIQSQQHSNCIKLKDALEYIISQAAPSFTGDVKSAFLFNDEWESDSSEVELIGENYVSGTNPNPFNKLYLIEKSDFINPDASQPATTGNITFKKMMDDLRELFANNLFWLIDIDGNFRIEHISHFTDQVGFDLVQDYADYIQASSNFEYLSKYIYSREIWQMDETGNSDFVDNEIKYGQIIAIDGEDENKKEHKVDNLYTDIDYMNEHLDKISNSGFVLVCAEGAEDNLTCKSTNGLISGESMQNADLSFANLIYLYGRHNRPVTPFTMNGVADVDAMSLRKLKRQDEIEFVNKDDRIDFSKNIHTYIGAGEVEEAEETLTKNIKVRLLYEH